jgi:hypothetical protein
MGGGKEKMEEMFMTGIHNRVARGHAVTEIMKKKAMACFPEVSEDGTGALSGLATVYLGLRRPP